MAKSNRPKTISEPPNKYRPNFWGMIQNILINATNRGQIIAGFVGMIVIIAIIRMPPQDIIPFFEKSLNAFIKTNVLGWVVATVTTVISVIMSNKARKLHVKLTTLLQNKIEESRL